MLSVYTCLHLFDIARGWVWTTNHALINCLSSSSCCNIYFISWRYCLSSSLDGQLLKLLLFLLFASLLVFILFCSLVVLSLLFIGCGSSFHDVCCWFSWLFDCCIWSCLFIGWRFFINWVNSRVSSCAVCNCCCLLWYWFEISLVVEWGVQFFLPIILSLLFAG